jgi:hypothetical protein
MQAELIPDCREYLVSSINGNLRTHQYPEGNANSGRYTED